MAADPGQAEPRETLKTLVGNDTAPHGRRQGVLRNTSLSVTVRRFRSRMMSTSCG